MRVTNVAALWYPDEKSPKPTRSQVLQATGTTTDSDSRSVGVCRRPTLKLESHITRLGHPQQTGNRPNSETSLRQINALTAAYLMLLSNKFSIVQQMAIDANHRVPTAKHPRYLLLSGLRVHIYCFLDFASTFTAFGTSRPHLLLSGLRIHIYRFSDFASTFTTFRTSRPHLRLSENRPSIYCFQRASAQHLLLSRGFGLAFTAFHGSVRLHSFSRTSKTKEQAAMGRDTKVVAETKWGVSHDLWLHPLIEHATKEGQAVSTLFWPAGSQQRTPDQSSGHYSQSDHQGQARRHGRMGYRREAGAT
ncbi:hypothetical protein CRG98_030996 [Punica granatum]|uniref:Uncharacterized protein n=1 Tax=Punica granatum TaxID=22663 RepID=A0A2I0IX52_PUNGR|nr:hypothetical protein CRG98_030996 [Punica granatum]